MRRMNKKGLEFKSAFFAVAIASLIIIATGVIIGEWDTKYDSGISYDLDEYENLNELSEEAQTQKGQITPQDADIGTGDFEGRLFRGGYGIVGRVFTPFRIVFNMLEAIEMRFGLPGYIGETILTMIVFSIITAIIAILFRLPRSNA